MKRIKYLVLCMVALLLMGCSLKNDDLEGATIYTTIYPINYITNYLYSEYGTISSIYPIDSDPSTYKLNDKQYKNYSKGNLFIYNGLSNEKQIAKELLNKNGNLLIIDVTYGLDNSNSNTDLWINPNNYLIVAKNIKTNLQENLKSKYIIESIEKKYSEFEEKISLIDARLHNLAKEANNKNRVVVVADKSFLFLQHYGFNVIDLSDPNIEKNNRLDNIKNNFKTSKYKYILAIEGQENNELVESLKGSVLTNKEFNGKDEKDYFNYMTNFVNQIETIVS